MSKKKVTAILCTIAFLVVAVFAGLYFFVIKNSEKISDFEEARQGMKPWDSPSAPGISLYVPDDYTRTENEYYSSYVKESAKVSLTSEEIDNDLANFAYNAVRKYEDITDSFTIKEEHDETVNSTDIHVVEFEYSLALDSGVKNFSCLSAYAMGDGRAYILTCTSDADKFTLFREDFQKISKTIALTDRKDENAE